MTQNFRSNQSATEGLQDSRFSAEERAWLEAQLDRLYNLDQERLRTQRELNMYYLRRGEFPMSQLLPPLETRCFVP